MRPTRRGLLAGAVLALLAGCTTGGDGTEPPSDSPGGSTPTGTPDAAGTPATTDETAETTIPTGTPTATDGGDGDLDLREANVTAVETERSGSRVRFSVTLYHDDDGEDGYANWWQVERLDGTQVGRRVLTHPHGTREFTRSDSYEIPEDVTCVVVRGHDQTHEFGGQAALVNLDSGAVRLIGQGSDPDSFSEGDCP